MINNSPSAYEQPAHEPRKNGDTNSPAAPEPSALIVCPDPQAAVGLAERIDPVVKRVEFSAGAREAAQLLSQRRFDVVLVDDALPKRGAARLCETAGGPESAISVIVISSSPTLDRAVRAIRAGACDLLAIDEPQERLEERVAAAVERAQSAWRRERRVERLQRLCHKLDNARREVSGRMGEVAGDLIGAYRDLSDQVSTIALASELDSLLRQELDIESLLRTVLEFLLARLGSTNAGVFLPTSSGDYSLGAYVNYDCPRDQAELMLDHLADTLAPRHERQATVRLLDSTDELIQALGDDAHWLEGHSTMVVACREHADDPDDECLAVLTLFRQRSTPFGPEQTAVLQTVAELFGRQLARVIRIHHRGGHTHGAPWETDHNDDPLEPFDGPEDSCG